MSVTDVYRLLEGTADAAFVITLDGEICFWNAAAEQLFGYRAADVLHRTCSEVLDGKGSLGIQVWAGQGGMAQCAADATAIPDCDLEVRTRSGQRKWVNLSTILFEDTHFHRHLIAHLARDISDRKAMEQAYSAMTEAAKRIMAVADHRVRPAPVPSLSNQEERILKLFAEAKNSGQVASELGITLPTLRNHLHAINQKLCTHNRLEAVLHALKRGLI